MTNSMFLSLGRTFNLIRVDFPLRSWFHSNEVWGWWKMKRRGFLAQLHSHWTGSHWSERSGVVLETWTFVIWLDWAVKEQDLVLLKLVFSWILLRMRMMMMMKVWRMATAFWGRVALRARCTRLNCVCPRPGRPCPSSWLSPDSAPQSCPCGWSRGRRCWPETTGWGRGAAARGVCWGEPAGPDGADCRSEEPDPENHRQLDPFHWTETEDCGETHET